MGIPGKVLNTSLDTRNKSSHKKKKQNERFDITYITNQDFRKLLKKFNNLPYKCYKSKQVHNEPTEDYFFLIKQITKIVKRERHVWPNFVKLGINNTIGHINKTIEKVNKTIGHFNKEIQSKELEINNEMTMWVDKDKQTPSA